MADDVVITGLGVVSGLGIGTGALWAGLCEGRCSFAPITSYDTSGSPCRLGAFAQGAHAKDYVPKTYRKAVKVMARDSELAVIAAALAVDDARLLTRAQTDAPTYAPARLGCQIGAGLIAADTNELTGALAAARADGPEGTRFDAKVWGESGLTNLPPLWMLKYLPNMLACHVTIVHGAEGPSNTITCAEASGLFSIGEGACVIRRGDADACLAGGAESKLNLMGHLRMQLAERLPAAGVDDDGARIVRPYDEGADGAPLGECGGMLVLERASLAKERGARAYARILGVGSGHDIHAEARQGDGLVVAIEAALDDAGISPDAVDAIVPHASGTPAMDAAEAEALEQVFGERLGAIQLVTLTPNIGECMAGAGGAAVAAGAMCLFDQRLPARIHAGQPSPDLRADRCEAREAALEHVLVCTNALGGQNAAIVLGRA